jgi:NADH-quinone oxidoreductase subunit G
VTDIADDTVWVPGNSFGRGVLADLGSPGTTVTVKGSSSEPDLSGTAKGGVL